MKGLYKFFSVATFGLIAASLVAGGALVVGTATGATGGAWLLWYFSMYSTFAAILMAVATTIVFLVGYYKEKDEKEYRSSRAVGPRAHAICG